MTQTRGKKKLTGISDIRRYFHRNPDPIYFIGATNFNLLGLDEWVKNFKYINYMDCYDGRHPNTLAPSPEPHPEACAALQRLPSLMAYNVTVVDRAGRFATAYLAPDRDTVIRQVPVAANHQGRIDWHDFARATSTLERERFLYFRLQDSSMTTERLIDYFLGPPLYTRAYANGFGTIYTAVYRPATGEATLIWPGNRVEQSMQAFRTGQHRQRFDADTVPAVVGPVH